VKKYDLNQSALYKCKSKNRLAKLLQIKLKDLMKLSREPVYSVFYKKKANSQDYRKIISPDDDLKIVQRRIFQLLKKVIRPFWLTSGEKGKCYIDNAAIHKEANYILTVDITKFFDSCKREYVYRFFLNVMQVSSDVACILSNLTTHNSQIPTGTSTSQVLAFYSYNNMFCEIKDLAKEFDCRFSLYVDDMTFSSDNAIKWKNLVNRIDVILKKYGHSLNRKKTKYYTANMAKIVTGVVITKDHKLCIPNKLRMKIVKKFKQMKIRKEPLREHQKIQGMVSSARNIENKSFPEISRIVSINLKESMKGN